MNASLVLMQDGLPQNRHVSTRSLRHRNSRLQIRSREFLRRRLLGIL